MDPPPRCTPSSPNTSSRGRRSSPTPGRVTGVSTSSATPTNRAANGPLAPAGKTPASSCPASTALRPCQAVAAGYPPGLGRPSALAASWWLPDRGQSVLAYLVTWFLLMAAPRGRRPGSRSSTETGRRGEEPAEHVLRPATSPTARARALPTRWRPCSSCLLYTSD